MTTTKTINIRIGGIVLLVLVGVASFLAWRYVRDTNRYKAQLSERDEKLDFYYVVVDNLKEQVTEAKLWVWSKEQALVLTEAQVERLKKQNVNHVTAIGELKLTVSALQDSLVLYRTKVVDRDTIIKEVPVENIAGINYVSLPVSFGKEDQYLTQWAEIDSTGTGSIGFEMQSFDISLTLGSRGVFKKDYVSAVAISNPYVTVDANNFQVVKQDKTKPAAYGIGAGFLAGVLTTWLLSR